MTAKNGNRLTVVRGFQGTAKAWGARTIISRKFMAYDHDAFIANITDAINKYNNLPASAKSGSYNDLSNLPMLAITFVLAADSMGTGAYASSVNVAIYGAAYQHNRVHLVIFDRTNAGAVTLNINNLGACPILRDGQPLSPGELVSTTYYLVAYEGNSGGRFHVLSQGARLNAQQLATPITGYTVGTNTALAAADTLLAALGKLQGQVNARITLTTVLTGYGIGTNAALAASDTILTAFGKLQAQVDARITLASAITGYAVGTNAALAAADSFTQSGND
jgi:hypothetical protein